MITKSILIVALAGLAGAASANPISDRTEARRLLDAGQWQAASAAYGKIIEVDPYHGGDWYRLGVARARLKNCKEAEPALIRALELGVDGYEASMRKARIEAAACALERGDKDAALGHLSIAQARLGLEDLRALGEDLRFSALLHDPAFRKLAGIGAGAEQGRVRGWRSDLDFFVELVERRHPNPFHSVGAKQWRMEAADFRRRIPTMDDIHVVAEFMWLAARIGDGHTSVYPPFEGERAFHLLPLFPYAFEDGWRIIAADSGYADLVGARIQHIDGVPMDEAATKIAEMLPRDNERTSLWLASVGLQFAEVAAAALGSNDALALTFDLELPNGQPKTVRIPAGPLDRNPAPAWTPEGWFSAEAARRPLWLAQSATPFWFTDIDGAVYAQVNQIRDSEEKTFESFSNELRDHLRGPQARRLIIDLRHNNGGNGYLNWNLVRAVIESGLSNQPDAVFVIVGRRTFSAAMNLASMLEIHTNAIFVGEPTGSRPNFYGEDTPFTLPYSGLQGSISSRWFQEGYSSNDERPWIAPDLYAPLTFEDLVTGRDPALEAIASYLQEPTK